jgi:hypothetical protein
VGENKIIEIKCPHIRKDMTAQQGVVAKNQIFKNKK